MAVKQLTLNQWVPGSSPGGCTEENLTKGLQGSEPNGRDKRESEIHGDQKSPSSNYDPHSLVEAPRGKVPSFPDDHRKPTPLD